MIYILTGGPATGKGTNADCLCDALCIIHLATGDMLREVALTNKEIREKLSKGDLISDEFVTKLLEERIKKDDCKKGFVLDGYPRTKKQAELLDGILEKLGRKVDMVINLYVDDEVAFRRILERRQCLNCNKKYGVDFPPEIDGVCDDCGGHLAIRTDDTKETLAKRIAIYREKSKDILEYYEKKGILKNRDASANPETIVDDVRNFKNM